MIPAITSVSSVTPVTGFTRVEALAPVSFDAPVPLAACAPVHVPFTPPADANCCTPCGRESLRVAEARHDRDEVAVRTAAIAAAVAARFRACRMY
jgi:hypothetical protein